MNRDYLNLEQDVEQPRWSWDHFASWGIDLWTFGQLNFQSFSFLDFGLPDLMMRKNIIFYKIENRS